MSDTIVETQTQIERLYPSQVEINSRKPGLGLSKKNKGDQLLLFPSTMLLRTSSLDRLRKFPAYVCTASSDIRWLLSSKFAIPQAVATLVKQLHRLLLTLSVYLTIVVLAIQLVVVSTVLVTTVAIPPGLAFMLLCICSLSVIAYISISSTGSNQKCSKNR